MKLLPLRQQKRRKIVPRAAVHWCPTEYLFQKCRQIHGRFIIEHLQVTVSDFKRKFLPEVLFYEHEI